MARPDIDYDFEDFGMSATDLAVKYAETQQHPVYNEATWLAYKNMPTRDVKLDYWDWVVAQIKKDDEAMPSNHTGEPPLSAFQEQLTEQQAADAELVNIDSVDQFAEYMARWHAHRLGQLRHFLSMPEGQTVTVTLDGKQEVVEMVGEAYRGFRAGILTAILQIDSLPFAVSVEDAIDTPVTDAPDTPQ